MLSVLIWLPIIAAIIIGFYPAKDIPANRIRLASLTVTGLVLLWNMFILLKFDINNPGMQFTEYLPWNETLGLSYHLGVDGLSILVPKRPQVSVIRGACMFGLNPRSITSRISKKTYGINTLTTFDP